MPATYESEAELDFGTDMVRGAVEVAFAALVLLLLVLAARLSGLWAQAPIPDPGASIEVLVIIGLAFIVALPLRACFAEVVLVIEQVMFAIAAIYVAFGGAAAGVLLRDLVVRGSFSAAEVSGTILVVAVPLIALWLWRELTGRHVQFPRLDVVGLAFLTSVIVAFTLFSFVVKDWNAMIKPWASWLTFKESVAHGSLLRTLGDLGGQLDSLFGLFGAALATAATFYIVTSVSPNLLKIIDYIGLSRAQITAAQKLRRPLSDLLRETKPRDALSRREFFITPDSFERESPLESPIAGGARVKIVAPPIGSPPNIITFDKIKNLLLRAQIDFRDSLFFVYLNDPRTHTKPVCYGTGLELWDLMQRPTADDDGLCRARFRGEFSDDFFGALNSGNAVAIQAVIQAARDQALENNPHDDLLLGKWVLTDTMEVQEALSIMKDNNLRRALVCTTKTPTDRAILGVPSIAAYLWPQPEAAVPPT